MPLWPLYQVEVFSTALAEANADKRATPPLKRYFIWQDQLTIPKDYPFPTTWRVSARGLLNRPLGNWSEPALLMDLTTTQRLAIGNGILTVENEAQAWARVDASKVEHKGENAAKAAVAMVRLRRQLNLGHR